MATLMECEEGGATQHGFTAGKLIGKGAFAEVFRATAPNGNVVALKRIQVFEMMDQTARDECLKEVKLLQQLDHPNIIKCLATFIQNNELNIVMEYADAGDLARLISSLKSKKQRLPEQYIWKYFCQITKALAYMHDQRVMHRDVKPANVLIVSGGVIKLADLGLGRVFGTFSQGVANSRVGTPYYMAPERLPEDGAYSYSSDVWSTGCLLYEMSALRTPFYTDSGDLYSLGQKILSGAYPALPPAYYSPMLIELVGQCLLVDSGSRPAMAVVAQNAATAFTLVLQQNKVAAPNKR